MMYSAVFAAMSLSFCSELRIRGTDSVGMTCPPVVETSRPARRVWCSAAGGAPQQEDKK